MAPPRPAPDEDALPTAPAWFCACACACACAETDADTWPGRGLVNLIVNIRGTSFVVARPPMPMEVEGMLLGVGAGALPLLWGNGAERGGVGMGLEPFSRARMISAASTVESVRVCVCVCVRVDGWAGVSERIVVFVCAWVGVRASEPIPHTRTIHKTRARTHTNTPTHTISKDVHASTHAHIYTQREMFGLH